MGFGESMCWDLNKDGFGVSMCWNGFWGVHVLGAQQGWILGCPYAEISRRMDFLVSLCWDLNKDGFGVSMYWDGFWGVHVLGSLGFPCREQGQACGAHP